jgi:hypothetical protein
MNLVLQTTGGCSYKQPEIVLQTTGGKDEPNIVFMWKPCQTSHHGFTQEGVPRVHFGCPFDYIA